MSVAKELSPLELLETVDKLSFWTESKKLSEVPKKEIRPVFAILNAYVVSMASQPQFQNPVVKEAIKELLEVAIEAASCLEKVHGKGSVTALKEFKDLSQFHQNKIVPLFPQKSGEAIYSEGVVKGGLEDLEAIKQDGDYELLAMRGKEGSAYVSSLLKNHLEAVRKIYALFDEEEGLHRKIDIARDRSCHETAKALLREKTLLIDEFYAQAFKFKNHEYISAVNKAMMALMLAGNPRNLTVNASQKSCEGYYRDFQRYLRIASELADGLKEAKEGQFLVTAMQLHSELCSGLFITPLNQKTARALFPQEKGALHEQLEKIDRSFRALLKTLPSGPILKASEWLHEKVSLFDPLLQTAPLGQLYRFTSGTLDISLLSLPTPTCQKSVDKVFLSKEFETWLHHLEKRENHHLLINLQDRTQAKEKPRCEALEAAKSHSLCVVSLDCHTPFYWQKGEYEKSDDFAKQCQEQLFSSGTGCHLPSQLSSKAMKGWVKECLDCVVDLFSSGKKITCEERLHCLELFYLLLSLKCAESIKADSLSFTDKDGCDTASMMNAELFCLLSWLNKGEKLSEEDICQALELFYVRALWSRGRLPRQECIERAQHFLAALYALFKEDAKGISKKISTLFQSPLVLQEDG